MVDSIEVDDSPIGTTSKKVGDEFGADGKLSIKLELSPLEIFTTALD